ncbi:MAG TPA: hypothetical protein VEK15_13180 [Vicinamibacteria bacterium]|nr:hypothetical protein [Vicinamibacteria bacterium]
MIPVKRELRFGIAILLAIQLLLGFAAIGLLSRIAPVIDQILQENDTSIEAAEKMLGVLALSRGGSSRSEDLDGEFFGALARARDNVTEEEEPDILDRVDRGYRGLQEGSEESLAATVEAVQELIGINRVAMRNTRDRASRLSEAGAWAAVLMALAGFAVGIVVAVRIQKRVVEPLDEIHAVVVSEKAGDRYRRCQYREAPPEVREIMSTLNELLDYRFSSGGQAPEPQPRSDGSIVG